MRRILLLLFLVFNSTLLWAQTQFNLDWKFQKGDTPKAQMKSYDDSGWRTIDLPHDWSIEDLAPEGNVSNGVISGPFDSRVQGGKYSGFTVGGIGWYRKHFKLAKTDCNKTIYVNFDGIYMNSTIWVNGEKVCQQPYGYSAFWVDITDFVHFGDEENVIAVQVKNTKVSSRWYAGSGIYRNVTLRTAESIHAEPWGIFVHTVKANAKKAEISVEANIKNLAGENSEVNVNFEVFDSNQKCVASKKTTTLLYDQLSGHIRSKIQVLSPKLWSPQSPNLYTLKTSIVQEGKVLDLQTTTFGIRTIDYDSEKGMFLNGKSIKLRGGAVHANNGCLGAAAYPAAERRRVKLMKDAGFNAVRCSHNPPSSAFLDECDRQGLLVIDEAFDDWTSGVLENDYKVYFKNWWQHDLGNMILRDRNHPSIFTWSIGNQIRNGQEPTGIELAHKLAAYTRSLDPTRPVTANIAMFIPKNWLDGTAENWEKSDALFEALDICGYSYQSIQYENVHERVPDRIQFSSEINPRDCFKNWIRMMDHDYVIGNFTWTAIDFMGEVGLGWDAWKSFSASDSDMFPWQSTYSGDIDFCGFKRPRSYYRNILFNHGKQLSAFVYAKQPSFKGQNNSPWGWDDVKPSWTWPGYEGENFVVEAYSSYETVELFLNNVSFGKKHVGRDSEFKAKWSVPYESGVLKAVAYSGDTVKDVWLLKTAGKPYEIRLTPDHTALVADRQDLCFLTVEVLDENGNLVPNADNLIHFKISGNAVLAGIGNGNPISVESFQQHQRKAYEGKCLLVVKTTDKAGEICIEAESEGLLSGVVSLITK